jgi:hypothetical protein
VKVIRPKSNISYRAIDDQSREISQAVFGGDIHSKTVSYRPHNQRSCAGDLRLSIYRMFFFHATEGPVM